MIIGKNFFIAEMPKAGSTFIRNYFKQYKDIELTIQHETINQNNRLELLEMDHRIGLIRNPYSWYLSIWRWSCFMKKKSPVYSDLISKRLKLKRLRLNKRLIGYIFNQITKDTNSLKSLFEDPSSKVNFNEFLKIILNFKYRNTIGSDYSFIPHKNIGYMTFSFFLQNAMRKDYQMLFDTSFKFSKIIKLVDKRLYTNLFFKTENLENDLKKFLIKNKYKIKNFKNLKKNESPDKFQDSYINFFSKDNMKLIELKDSYIFKKFKYKKLSK